MLGVDSGSECTEALSLGLCDESDDEFREPGSRGSERPGRGLVIAQSSAAAETAGQCDCTRCNDDRSFVPHDDGCKRTGVHRHYVVCPRCHHVHLDRCLAKETQLTSVQRRNRYNPLSMMQHSEQPVELH